MEIRVHQRLKKESPEIPWFPIYLIETKPQGIVFVDIFKKS